MVLLRLWHECCEVGIQRRTPPCDRRRGGAISLSQPGRDSIPLFSFSYLSYIDSCRTRCAKPNTAQLFCEALRRLLHGFWAVCWVPFVDFVRHLLAHDLVDFPTEDQIRRHVPHVPFVHVPDALFQATQVDARHSVLVVPVSDKRFLCGLAFSANVSLRSIVFPIAVALSTAASAAFAFASACRLSLPSIRPDGSRPAHVADRFQLGAASAAMTGTRSSCSRRAAQAHVPGLSSQLRRWRPTHGGP